jgi:hypothetical protein
MPLKLLKNLPNQFVQQLMRLKKRMYKRVPDAMTILYRELFLSLCLFLYSYPKLNPVY